MPQKADSGSEVDSDSGSEDQGRGGAVKRKPAPAKVIAIIISRFNPLSMEISA